MKLFTKLLTKWPTAKTNKTVGRTIFISTVALLATSFISCEKKTPIVIIWTDKQEIAQYTEYFNATHSSVKAVAVYKENPEKSLPPIKKEIQPDLVIGPWLKGANTRKYFAPLDYLFKESSDFENQFYPQLLDYGRLNNKQYLIPLSFNLPMMIFAEQNESLVENEHTINLEDLKNASSRFNSMDKDGNYTAMGYAPSWDKDFLYESTKIFGTGYQEKGLIFSWNEHALDETVEFMRNWTLENNKDSETENNFEFKYQHLQKNKQISSGRCAFAFTNSNEFFNLSTEQTLGLTFRWLVDNNEKIQVQDDIITLGMYKKSKNKKAAEEFIKWLYTEQTQADLMHKVNTANLDTNNYGLAGGFSAIKNVNTNVFPSHYRSLLGNLPAEQSLAVPNILPSQWLTLKEMTVDPYLKSATNTSVDLKSEDFVSMEELVENSKKFAY